MGPTDSLVAAWSKVLKPQEVAAVVAMATTVLATTAAAAAALAAAEEADTEENVESAVCRAAPVRGGSTRGD